MRAAVLPLNQKWLTPPQVAEMLSTNPAKVIAWIRSRELPASNIAEKRGGRPRWRIAPDDLLEFLRSRRLGAVVKENPKRRISGDVIRFF